MGWKPDKSAQWECWLSWSPKSKIKFKFLLKPCSHRITHSTKNLAFHSLLRWKDYYTTNSHYLTYTFLFKRLGECTFWTQGTYLEVVWLDSCRASSAATCLSCWARDAGLSPQSGPADWWCPCCSWRRPGASSEGRTRSRKALRDTRLRPRRTCGSFPPILARQSQGQSNLRHLSHWTPEPPPANERHVAAGWPNTVVGRRGNTLLYPKVTSTLRKSCCIVRYDFYRHLIPEIWSGYCCPKFRPTVHHYFS